MGRKNHFHAITRPQPDKVHSTGRTRVSQYFAPVIQPYAPLGLGQLGEHFGGQWLPSACLIRSWPAYGLVRTHGPSAVTATQCSKWAE